MAKIIKAHQNPKFGLRYFFTGAGNRDLTARLELGPGDWYSSSSYQLDSGPDALHRARTGQEMQRPAARSAASWSRSMPAVASPFRTAISFEAHQAAAIRVYGVDV